MSAERERELERLARENEALRRRVTSLERQLEAAQAGGRAAADHGEAGARRWSDADPQCGSEVSGGNVGANDVVARRESDADPQRGSDADLQRGSDVRGSVEARLRHHEALLAHVLDALPVGLWITDARGAIHTGNEAGRRIWAGARFVGVEGYGEYKGWWASTGKRIEPEEWAAARAVAKGESSIEEEIDIECFDGTRKTILNSAIPLRDADGCILGAVIVNQDITQRKQAERALQRSKAELIQAQRIGAVGNWIIEGENRIAWSDETYRIYGKSREGFTPTVSNFVDLIHPDDKPKMQVWLDDFFAGRATGDLEFRIPQPDGSVRVANGRGAITFDDEGRPIHMAGTVQDITARKRAEVERERLLAAIEQAGEIVCITNPGGQIEYVNAAFETVTGYSRGEALGKNPRMLQSGKTSEAMYGELWETIKDGRPWRGRIENRRKDGSLFTQDMTITPIIDSMGHIVNFVAVMRDVTEELRLAEQLLASQKLEAVGGLAGGIAHDFNNLLAVILGCARLAMADRPKDDQVYEDLAEIVAAGERAAVLTRQLLAFSRKQVLEPKVLVLNHVVEGLLSMLRRLIGEDVELAAHLAPDLGRVKADPGQLEQVIMNLAVNARDAMPHGGKLTIETANVELDETFAARHVLVKCGPYVMLAMSDNGCGMDDATQLRMFEPFFTTKPIGQGTGLGLSTVYGIVKQSGGNIWVYSEVGRGTTVRVYLPRLESNELPQRTRFSSRPPPNGTETILLVEDEPTVRATTTRMLEAAGYHVLTASSGVDAIARYANLVDAIDLLLTDVVMPQMSGVELATRLKELRPDIPVLYMSGYTNDAMLHHGALISGMSFLAKPFNASELAKKVRAAVTRRPSVEE